MKKTIFILTLSILISQSFNFAQKIDTEYFRKNLEVYFKFELYKPADLHFISKIISIDKLEGRTVFAYANQSEFSEFRALNISYILLPHPGDVGDVRMGYQIEDWDNWNSYPTYQTYVEMMYQFSANYPEICKIIDAGITVQGRKILFAKISDNVDTKESEPQFMFTSSIHGDETTGYVLMLRLIDSLLTGYGANARITNLVDKIEIWINPLANPDGTYWGGNNSVSGARRYNANGIDLNRNFPDPDDGLYPTGPWQPETMAMMNLAEDNNFILSANFHGGTEVVNYPWDTWAHFHADDDWLQLISRQYADTVHANAPSTYMTGYNNGITNGYQWYSIAGGRQDYMTYFQRCRETTIEISDSKLLNPSLLPAHWNYNRKSFLNYIEQCLFGISGIITDEHGNPIKANITILGHDMDNSDVFSDSATGFYNRMIFEGIYDIKFSAEDYFDHIINGVQFSNNSITTLNVQLNSQFVPVELTLFSAQINENIVHLTWETETEKNNMGFNIERKRLGNSEWEIISFIPGKGNSLSPSNYKYFDRLSIPGSYIYRLEQTDYNGSTEYSEEVKVSYDTPEEFTLFQNYPNPFNGTTRIKFFLPNPQGVETSTVRLELLNLIGERIALLIDEKLPGGIYEAEVQSASLASGQYIYRLVYGERSLTKKMILLK